MQWPRLELQTFRSRAQPSTTELNFEDMLMQKVTDISQPYKIQYQPYKIHIFPIFLLIWGLFGGTPGVFNGL